MESRPLTTMAVFLAIVFVIAAAYAATGYFGAEDADTADSSGDQLDSSQEIRSVPVEWDTVTKELTIGTGSDAYTRTVTEYVVAVDGDDVCVLYGDSGTPEWMTVGEFMAGVRVPSLEGLTAVGEETIGTDYGNVNCTVMRGGSGDSMIWVDSHGVVYRSTYTEGGVPVRAELQGTTLFQIDPLDEGGALNSEPLGADSYLQYYDTLVNFEMMMEVTGWVDGTYFFDGSGWSHGLMHYPSYRELLAGEDGSDYTVSIGTFTIMELGEMRAVTLTSETAAVEEATYIIDIGYLPIRCLYADPDVRDLDIQSFNYVRVFDKPYGSELPAPVVRYDKMGRQAIITAVGTSGTYYIWMLEIGDYRAYFRGDAELRLESKGESTGSYSIDDEGRTEIEYNRGVFESVEFFGAIFDQVSYEPSHSSLRPGSTVTYEIDTGTGPIDYKVEIVGWYANIYYVEGPNSSTVFPWISEAIFTDMFVSGSPVYDDTVVDVPGIGPTKAVRMTYDDGRASYEAVFLSGLDHLLYSYEISDGSGGYERLTMTSSDPLFGFCTAIDHDTVSYTLQNTYYIYAGMVSVTSDYGYVFEVMYSGESDMEYAYYIGDYNGIPVDLEPGQTTYVLHGYENVVLHTSGNKVAIIEVDGIQYSRK